LKDVSEGAWYDDAVAFCAARGITNGTGSDRFSPDATLTRAQFLAMLMRAYGNRSRRGDHDNFDDAG
jgi:hypothetical protein